MCYKIRDVKSTLKTTAAVLRKISGEKDSVWAEDILGRSVHTIRHLEAGTLKLSADLAAKMNYESGISIKWLMDGDPTAPPVTAGGEEYTKEIYERVQARKKYFATVRDSDVQNTVLDALRAICAILVSANRKRNFRLAVYRTAKALAEWRDEFGEAKDFNTINKALDYVRDAPRWRPGVDVFEPPPEHLREGSRRIQQLIRDDAPTKLEDLSCLPDKQPTSKRKLKQPLKKRRRAAVALKSRKPRPSSQRRRKA
jgi:hypothetical protein